MSTSVPQAIRKYVFERADHYCEYCQSSELTTGQAFHCEHINPRKYGGTDDESNLCCACPRCNGGKATAVQGVDPASGETVRLFNPRTDLWKAHFVWIENGLRVAGLTAIGRATVDKLKMNDPLALSARIGWINNGTHPPT